MRALLKEPGFLVGKNLELDNRRVINFAQKPTRISEDMGEGGKRGEEQNRQGRNNTFKGRLLGHN